MNAARRHRFTRAAATAADLTGLGKGNAFRLLANDGLQGKAMAGLATGNLGAKRIAMVIEAGSYGRGSSKAFAASMPKSGAQIVASMEVGSKDEVTPAMARRSRPPRPTSWCCSRANRS